jgi:hypothetical protein
MEMGFFSGISLSARKLGQIGAMAQYKRQVLPPTPPRCALDTLESVVNVHRRGTARKPSFKNNPQAGYCAHNEIASF